MDEDVKIYMAGKLMVKLLTDVFKKLPPESYLCVDILFDFVAYSCTFGKQSTRNLGCRLVFHERDRIARAFVAYT